MKVNVKSLSCVRLFATPWVVAYQVPPSMGFSRQECWSGMPFPSPGDLPNLGIEPRSPALQSDALLSEPPGKPAYDQTRQHIKKQRHYFANRGPSRQTLFFPVVMYRCESWTIKKAEDQRIDAFELWCWRRLLSLQGDPTSPS